MKINRREDGIKFDLNRRDLELIDIGLACAISEGGSNSPTEEFKSLWKRVKASRRLLKEEEVQNG